MPDPVQLQAENTAANARHRTPRNSVAHLVRNQHSPRHAAPPDPLTVVAADSETLAPHDADRFAQLTDRQLAIVSMLVQGMSQTQIAEQLGVTKMCVSQIVKYAKLDGFRAFTRPQLKALAQARWMRIKHAALDRAAKEMDSAGPYQAVMMAAIAEDKEAMLDAPPPSHEIAEEVTLTLRRISRADTTTRGIREPRNYEISEKANETA